MNEVKTVKKIKKVVVTEDTRYQTFGINTEFKSDKQSSKSENKEYSKIVNLDCVDSKSNDVVVKKVKKVVKSVEPTYYVHTCGYDYVVDTIDVDVAFSGTKDECDEWMKEHSIVEGLEDNTNPNEYMNEVEHDDSPCDFTDFESGKVEVKNTADLPTVKKVKKCVASDERSVCEPIDYGKQIVFTKVTDLNADDYKDFDKEKYPHGISFYDFEVFGFTDSNGVKHSDWCVTFLDVINLKMTTIVNDRKFLIKYYSKMKDTLFVGYNSKNYDVTILKAILLGMDAKDVSNKLIVDGLKAFQINEKFKEIQFYNFDIMKLNCSLKLLEAFAGHNIEETSVPFDIDRFLTKDEWDMTVHYNIHDVTETCFVFRKRIQEYVGHIGIMDMFKFPFDYINKTKAQLTAEVTKCKRPEQKRTDDWDLWIVDTVKLNKYKFVADWFMSLRDDHDRDRIETYENGKFVPYKGNDSKAHGYELHFEVGGVPHIAGLGGLHGCPKEPIQIKDKILRHSDATSLYPTLMLQYNLFTRNAQEPQRFKEVYDTRIRLKHQDDKESKKLSKVLKIILNSQFGIQGDINSNAYDIRNCRMVCITGQLLILSLMESLQPYVSFWNVNTDGIVYTINDEEHDTEKVFEIIKDFENYARIKMETDIMKWLVQSQVNGYVFEFENGEYERKGKYLKENSEIDNDLPIANEAMFEYIAHGKNVEDYINSCDDLIKFQKIVRISSNYKFAIHNGEKTYNKTYRVFASKDLKDTEICKCKYEIGELIEGVNGKMRKYSPEKFADTPLHCFIDNTNVEHKKCSDYPNFDKQWYINLVYDRLRDQYGIDARPDIFSDMF